MTDSLRQALAHNHFSQYPEMRHMVVQAFLHPEKKVIAPYSVKVIDGEAVFNIGAGVIERIKSAALSSLHSLLSFSASYRTRYISAAMRVIDATETIVKMNERMVDIGLTQQTDIETKLLQFESAHQANIKALNEQIAALKSEKDGIESAWSRSSYLTLIGNLIASPAKQASLVLKMNQIPQQIENIEAQKSRAIASFALEVAPMRAHAVVSAAINPIETGAKSILAKWLEPKAARIRQKLAHRKIEEAKQKEFHAKTAHLDRLIESAENHLKHCDDPAEIAYFKEGISKLIAKKAALEPKTPENEHLVYARQWMLARQLQRAARGFIERQRYNSEQLKHHEKLQAKANRQNAAAVLLPHVDNMAKRAKIRTHLGRMDDAVKAAKSVIPGMQTKQELNTITHDFTRLQFMLARNTAHEAINQILPGKIEKQKALESDFQAREKARVAAIEEKIITLETQLAQAIGKKNRKKHAKLTDTIARLRSQI